nr:MAG TPA: hypothetical protein [Caudoviricetes sp.]
MPPHRLNINVFFGIFLHTFFSYDKFSKHVAANNRSNSPLTFSHISHIL